MLRFIDSFRVSFLLDGTEQLVELALLERVFEKQQLPWAEVDRIQVVQDLDILVIFKFGAID